MSQRSPKGTCVSVDELVDMSRSVVDRMNAYVARTLEGVKAKLHR